MKVREYHGEVTNRRPSPECQAYYSAKYRCESGNEKWGGRGIEFRFTSFSEFLGEVGRKPTPRHQLDRINNNGHYEKGNVRWATPKEQALNRRSNVYLTFEDITQTAQEWAEQLGISSLLIRQRKQRDGLCDACCLRAKRDRRSCIHKVSIT